MSESIRILIAEDNALLRGVLRDALAEAGMTVVAEASDGAEAVGLAEETTPDVVVMDMRMPNVDGIEATERIAQSAWAMPVVVLSAYDEPQMIEAALAAGATSCLKKGVGLDELIEAIRAAQRALAAAGWAAATSPWNRRTAMLGVLLRVPQHADAEPGAGQLEALHHAVRRPSRDRQALADPAGSLVMAGVHLDCRPQQRLQAVSPARSLPGAAQTCRAPTCAANRPRSRAGAGAGCRRACTFKSCMPRQIPSTGRSRSSAPASSSSSERSRCAITPSVSWCCRSP